MPLQWKCRLPFLQIYLFIFGCAWSLLRCGLSLVAASGGCSLVAVFGLLSAGTEPLSPALAGRFPTPEPPGRPGGADS